MMTMATTEFIDRKRAGILPWVNDLVAVGVLFFVYVVRIGFVEEGVRAPWWLSVTTDAVLPVLAAVWLLVVPAYRLWVVE
jgi:hypothetical protein